MLKSVDFSKFQTPTDVILFQTNLAKTALAYVPNEEVRTRLSTIVEMNAALATSFWDAVTAYSDSLKTKVFAA